MPELPLSPSGRRYGWIRAPKKHTAYGIASIPGLKIAAPPPIDMHLAEFMQAVKDQGQLGSCTAHAGTEDREALAAQYQGKQITLSPIFLYYIERQLDGTLDQGDCGSTGETSCRALNQFGCCLESDDPYDTSAFQTAPSPDQLTEAIAFKAGAYHSLFTAEDVKLCINSGYRVRIGMNVYDSFENIGSDGLMPNPNPNKESLLGGHEILIYGYDDTVQCPHAKSKGAVRVRNSWGKDWGLNGDFWMSYEMLAVDSTVQPDLKIQHLGKPWGK
jgi:C1A family cysteine protease